jgi:hypothetical protein
MGWSIGYDDNWNRWVGYGVPAYCDHPQCSEEIDRGLSYVCGNDVYGGEHGCGLFFCPKHQVGDHQRCPRCAAYKRPYRRPKGEHPRWVRHVRTDTSWSEWRRTNPRELNEMIAKLEVA